MAEDFKSTIPKLQVLHYALLGAKLLRNENVDNADTDEFKQILADIGEMHHLTKITPEQEIWS